MHFENTERYKIVERYQTNRSINYPPGVIFGRTLSECTFTTIIFFIPSYLDFIFYGFFAAILYFIFCIKIRKTFPKCILQHFLYGLGIYSMENNNDINQKNYKKKKSIIKKILEKIGIQKHGEYVPKIQFRPFQKIFIFIP
jgi:hypothetical protein